jgi:hypothetical protein
VQGSAMQCMTGSALPVQNMHACCWTALWMLQPSKFCMTYALCAAAAQLLSQIPAQAKGCSQTSRACVCSFRLFRLLTIALRA